MGRNAACLIAAHAALLAFSMSNPLDADASDAVVVFQSELVGGSQTVTILPNRKHSSETPWAIRRSGGALTFRQICLGGTLYWYRQQTMAPVYTDGVVQSCRYAPAETSDE